MTTDEAAALIGRLETYRDTHELTYLQLAEVVGVPSGTLCRVLNRVSKPRQCTLSKIRQFFEEQDLLPPEPLLVLLEDQETCFCGQYECDRSQTPGHEWSSHSANVSGIFRCEGCADWLLPWGCILRGDDPI